jgi:2-keto-3-deoxy-L-rhamnonate aldolase RhmA
MPSIARRDPWPIQGIDGIFLGRGDLTVALGADSMDAPVVRDAAIRQVTAAAVPPASRSRHGG